MSSRGGARDDGQLALFVLLDVIVCLGLVVVMTSAGAVHLTRHRLQAVADAAALDAADALEPGRFYTAGAGRSAAPVPLSDATVAASVEDHLRAAGAAARFDRLAVRAPTGTPDGVTAEVTLEAVVPLPLIGGSVAGLLDGPAQGVSVRVTGRARAAAVP